MSEQEKPLVERLCLAEDPVSLGDWHCRDDYYLATCRISADDLPQLIDLAAKWTAWEWPTNDDTLDMDPDDAAMLSVAAWRALGELKAEAAVAPLLDMLRQDEYDEWMVEEFPHVFGKIGEPAIEPLIRVAEDVDLELARAVAVEGLGNVAKDHPHTRDRIVGRLTRLIASAGPDEVEFNSAVLVQLVDLQAAEAAEPIERAFAANLLDVGVIGGWEDVRSKLKVEGLGLEMPENPHDSIADYRRRAAGIGIFSSRPVYDEEDVDEEAAEAYYEQAFDAFSQSDEGREAVKQQGNLQWPLMLLDFGVRYRGQVVDAMTVHTVEEFVFEFVPRKVVTEPDAAEEIVGQLLLFWQYLGRVHRLPEARAIIAWLDDDTTVSWLKQELSDSSNFGMAKSFFTAGDEAGYDMSSPEGLAAFTSAFDRQLTANQLPAESQPRVGRNDPCPCGSGKKY